MTSTASKHHLWSGIPKRLLFVSVLACGSCAGSPESADSSFEELTLTTSPGFVAPSPDAECDVARSNNKFKLSASTHELSWDTCEWTAQQAVEHRVGMRILDDGAFASIERAYANVAPSKEPQCVSDIGGARLEVLSGKGQRLFVDDRTAACGQGQPAEGVAVTGLSELADAMRAAR